MTSLPPSGATRQRGRPTAARPAALVALLLALAVLTSCAPGAFGPAAAADPVSAELERTARALYHRMELGFLELGAYTTNVLIDAKLPEGARWTLQDFAADGSYYVLVLTSSRLPGVGWRVSPRGVSRFSGG